MTLQTVEFNADLLKKYAQPLPRYTSYPPATELRESFNSQAFENALVVGNKKQTPLSLYCHIPFCETPCYFCGCNTLITQRKEVAETYLDYVFQNIDQVASWVDARRTVNQFHWGGGTPNYLNLEQVEKLWTKLSTVFRFEENAEVSIEVNPKYLDNNYILFLRSLGFNRISFGIQDFNPKVQEAINRIQSESLLFQVMDWIREAGFESVNVDLVYGLPYQTLATFEDTIEKAIQLDPDRIALFNFAYVPWLKPVQRLLPEAALPSGEEKLRIFQMSIEKLTQQGYVFIGMDHFAKPDDELAIAQQKGQLHRNFQGYTTKPESDLLSFGMTAISMLHDVYIQNQKRLKDYYQDIEANRFPIQKGVQLNPEDHLRQAIIIELMCQFHFSPTCLQEKYGLQFNHNFSDYFAPELAQLQHLATDGLVEIDGDTLEVTPRGRLLIRNIVSVFDTYLKQKQQKIFSQAI
ncbi:oxygen-independent coproporphyrinogen III oxidase [Spirulina sp. CS-785/01]|uniref:oxygen-independent coproporphyrinogen III oxidase n=1 Tax=Spirulina sp. CS-785/01 TaxID=3021716 RepID=UPI00232F46BE|nr:oxygen-independent coproporphyrinogen III oxidase [Spirulina sp. CS-785/01]MDB9314283.1 oxygen-independent coproporphyrinogen III oxidase [Spirulina sp. CS-785/01]